MAIPDRLNLSQQENVLTLLAHSDEHGKLLAQMIDPELFEGDYRLLATRIIDYWQKHGQAPKAHTPDLVGEILEDPHNRKANTYRRILADMLQLQIDGINAEYVLSGARTLRQVQGMKAAIWSAAEMLNSAGEQSVEQVRDVLSDMLRARDDQFDFGMHLHDIDRLIEYAEKQQAEFEYGIPELDRRNIIPTRKTTTLFLAPKGFGKSWFLANTAKRNILGRKRVLYVSNEMGEEAVQQRMYQALFAVPKREAEIEVLTLRRSRDGSVLGFKQVPVTPEFTFEARGLREELEQRIKLFGYRMYQNMVIKRFPPRSLTAAKLRAYLDSLEATQGFIPDLILIDNIGNMKTDSRNHRLTLSGEYDEVVGIGVERNMAIVATHQVSKEGMKSGNTRPHHAAEAWAMIYSSDFVLTYSATPAERRLGLARLYVGNARTEEDEFGVLITQKYAIGQFVLESAYLENKYYDYLKEYAKARGMSDREDDEEEEEGDDDDR